MKTITRLQQIFKQLTSYLYHAIKRVLIKIVHFIARERKQKLYVLISNQTQKATRNFALGYSFIALMVIFITTSVLGSIYYHQTQHTQKNLIETARSDQERYSQKLSALSEKATEFNTHQETYQNQINDILAFLGNHTPNQLWKSADHTSTPPTLAHQTTNPLDNLFPDHNIETAQNILKELQANQIIAQASYPHLTNLKNYLALKQNLSTAIPNGWPIERNKGYKTSGFGPRFSPFEEKMEFHQGVDIAAGLNSLVIAAADGYVEANQVRSGFGKIVILRHAYGYKTLYAHNNSILVTPGTYVKRGQPIAKVGNTGRSTGNHLHFEIRIGNEPVDPWPYMAKSF
ncbi:hypothetical protein COTS27_00942 [Spirochaetota bacterium]|nr:hypothetical protein COTS27_00942 [Spirochaetota bacterium]